METQAPGTTPVLAEIRPPTFQQWWGHLRRSGLLAAAQARMTPDQIAEMATQTYQITLRQIAEQTELAQLVETVTHPYGDA